MDEEMEEVVDGDRWLDFDVDLDYEYDAPRFFDLSNEEPVVESISAEKWFDTAESYPPSPLIMKIVCDNITFPEDGNHNLDAEAQPNTSELIDVTKEAEDDHSRLMENVPKVSSKPRVKNNASKVSTLMKPTASYLAKKAPRYEVPSLIRNNNLDNFRSMESSGDSKDCTVQATKRQRLERGHLGKAIGTAQPDLIHKAHDKPDIAHANGNAGPSRVRLTIPREPNLQTMRRAERFHARRGLIKANEPQEHVQQRTAHKTHSSNRNEFNIMNKGRVHGDPSGVASKALQGYDKVSRKLENRNSRLNSINQKQKCGNGIFFFKAAPSDKKDAPSNGEVVVSRNIKPQTTVPKEQKLYAGGRRQQNPPPLTEVFNKLSLATEAWHVSTSKAPIFVPSNRGSKDSKENIRINHLR